MTSNIASITPLPPQLPVKEIRPGSLQGRIISILPGCLRQEFTWDKISSFFKEAIEWIKNLFTPVGKPPAIEMGMPVEPIKITPPDTSFLRPEDPGYNLKRLSEISAANAVQSVTTENAYKTVPHKNPIRLGYDNHVQYQTELGDRAIAIQAGATALGILGISRGSVFSCMVGNEDEYARAYEICRKNAASIWQNTSGKTLLAGSALLLAASLYAHRKGWIGALLHDRSMGWRRGQIETLFRDAAKELSEKAKTKPQDAEKLAKRIFMNAELIESALHLDLQLPAPKAKEIADLLKTACLTVLDKNEAPQAAPVPKQEILPPTAGETP